MELSQQPFWLGASYYGKNPKKIKEYAQKLREKLQKKD